MSVDTLSACSLEYPSSALRYGLLDIRPIPTEEIVKIGKWRLRQKGIRYEPIKKITTFEDYISFRYERILSTMPLPEAFSTDDLVDYFVGLTTKWFNEDKELREEIQKAEKSLLAFVNFIRNRFENSMSEYYMTESQRFLNSNLPLSFYSDTSMYIDTYRKYLSLVKRIVRRYEILSRMGGVRRRFEHVENELNKMKRALSPLIDKMDLCSLASVSLRLYLCVWSAETFEEIDEPKLLDMNKLDPSYFEEYKTSYDSELRSLRRMIFVMSKEYDPDIISKEVTFDDPTTIMLTKLLPADLS